jgi:hypothetical protein
VGKQPLVGRSTGSPTLKEAARETIHSHDLFNLVKNIISFLDLLDIKTEINNSSSTI